LTFVASEPPSVVAKDVDAMLERICLRAMATEAAARYPRALEMAEEIQRWLDEHPLVVQPHTRRGRMAAAFRGNAGLIVVGLVMVILLLIGVMVMRGW